MLLVNSCVRYPRILFKLMAGAMFLAALMSGLLFVGLASEKAIPNSVQDWVWQSQHSCCGLVLVFQCSVA